MARFKKININTDRILGLSAMLVSLLSLIFFIYQTNIMRDQSRLSVKPRLVFNTNVQSGDSLVTFRFLVKNKGLGPAIIKKARIVHESDIYPLDFDFFIGTIFPKLDEYGSLLSTSNLSGESIISVDESQTLFMFRANMKDVVKINKYLKLNEGAYVLPWDVQITYESLYEEEWDLSYQQTQNRIEKE